MFKEGDEYWSQVYGTQKVREGEEIVSGSVQMYHMYAQKENIHSKKANVHVLKYIQPT